MQGVVTESAEDTPCIEELEDMEVEEEDTEEADSAECPLALPNPLLQLSFPIQHIFANSDRDLP